MTPAPQAIEHLPLDTLAPYARNSRTHSPEQIDQVAASIREFGFTNPVLIDAQGGIIAGHGRVMAARQLGLVDVPCIRLAHLTEAQKRAYVIADNKLALNAGWDADLLALELRDLAAMNFDTALTGFSDDELADLLDGLDGDGEGQGDADAIPEPQPDPISRTGDVWLLGRHRVMCGDSTDAAAVAALLLRDPTVGLLFTDPPYNLSFEGQDLTCTTKNGKRVNDHVAANAKHAKIHNDEMSKNAFYEFMCRVLMNVKKAKPASWYFCFTDLKLDELLIPLRQCGFDWKSIIVWMKNQATLSGKDYKSRYEPIVYGCQPGAFCGDRYALEDVWQFQRTLKNDLHPTMKPIPLIECAIANSSKRNDVVLDVFGGSGSTLIACENTSRDCRMMELDPKYVDVIVRRWQNFTGQRATHADTGAPFPDAPQAPGA